MNKKVRFFLKRSSKVEIRGKQPIVIPFQLTTVLLLLVMILVSIFLFLRSDLFQINQIVVVGKIPSCATVDGIKLTSEAAGTSIIFYDTKHGQKLILEKFYCLANIKLIKNYPSRLTIETFERIPVAALVQIETTPNLLIATGTASTATTSAFQGSPSAFFALDKTGVIFENLPNTLGLPKILFPARFALGSKISDMGILWLLDFLAAAENFNLNFDKFTKTAENLLVGETRDGIQLIMSSETDAAKIASSLQAILRQAKIEGANFKILDLRFEKPILR